MPRYLFETGLLAATVRAHAGRIAAQRYPEVEVEHTYVVERDGAGRELWVCRAPSESHLRRWAAATELPVEALRRIDADVATRPEGGPGRPEALP